MQFLSDNNGEDYNLCHCECLFSVIPHVISITLTTLLVWSNFEIGDLDFWRGEAYSKFFDHLDQAGGFYYEVRQHFNWIELRKSG